jgi:HK97 gp10 family phage protein
MKKSVEIKGLDSLKSKLEKLSAGVQASVTENSLTAGALKINNAWTDRISPENNNFRTGTYKRSVHTEYNPGNRTAMIGTDISSPPYPLFLETGTSRGMTARPAMEPAFNESVDAAKKEIEDVLRLFLRSLCK